MKRFLIFVLTIALSICIVGCSGSTDISTASIKYLTKNTTDPSVVSSEYRTVYENNSLILKFNDATTDVCVVDKTNDFVWSTDVKTSGDENLYNILYLTYHTDAGNVGVLSTSNHCIPKGQYKTEETENGIKVKYTIGEVATEYIYPETLTPERYEYFYEKCDDDGKYLLEVVYTKIDISFYDEETQAEMNKKYPYAVDGKIYIPRNVLNDVTKAELSDMFNNIGYTKEDLKTDHTVIQSDSQDNIAVNVSVYYRIDDDTFTVNIPENEIEYPSFVHIDSMNVLESFVGQTSNEGYFVLPDGSGSIMNFRNDKVAENYRVQIYGQENTIFAENKSLNLQNAIFPVYGCVSDNNGYFVIIEDGESHTYINATSGDDKTTPRVWVDFTVEPVDYMVAASNIVISSGQKNSVYQTDRYDGSLSMKYKFFADEKANYSEMAHYYQDYLFGSKSKTEVNEYPITVKTIGSVKKKKTLLGFNYFDIYTLTSYSDSEKIVNDLLESGVSDVNLVMMGWTGKGYDYGYSDKIKPINELGKTDELKTIIEKLNEKNVSVYLDFDVQYAEDGVKSRNIAEFLDESKATVNIYDKAVFEKLKKTNSLRYTLTPKAACNAVTKAYEYITDYQCGLSFSTIGSDLNADYNTKRVVDRQDSQKIIAKKLGEVSENKKISTNVGNAYVLPFVEQLNNVSVRSNGQDMTDYSIPFVGMVLSGYLEYSAAAFNDSNNEKTDLLRAIESNAALSVVLTENDMISVNMSEYDLPSSTKYNDVKDSAVFAYQYCSEALEGVYGKEIVNHIIHANGVRELDFENNVKIYINYSNDTLTVDGKKIDALSYMKEEE